MGYTCYTNIKNHPPCILIYINDEWFWKKNHLNSDYNYWISYLFLIFLRYPTVCIFSSGDELDSNKDGSIRDTNSLMIKQILEQDGYLGQILNFGIVRDK